MVVLRAAYNPYKYTDPDGEFAVLGAAIGAVLDVAVQVGASMSKGESFGSAVKQINIGQVAASAVLGSVGMVGTSFAKGAVTGTVALGKNSMTLATTTEKVMSGVKGVQLFAAAQGANMVVKGEEGRAFVKETLNSAVEAVKEGANQVMEKVTEKVEEYLEK